MSTSWCVQATFGIIVIALGVNYIVISAHTACGLTRDLTRAAWIFIVAVIAYVGWSIWFIVHPLS
jgi:hypothetical protein